MMRELVKEAKDKCPPNARAHGVSNGKRTLLAATRWSAPNLLNKGLHLTVSSLRSSLAAASGGRQSLAFAARGVSTARGTS